MREQDGESKGHDSGPTCVGGSLSASGAPGATQQRRVPPSDAIGAGYYYRFVRLLLNVVYPLLRDVFKKRFQIKFGREWTDNSLIGKQFVKGFIPDAYDKELPGSFEIRDANNEIFASENVANILQPGTGIRLGGAIDFVVHSVKQAKRGCKIKVTKTHTGETYKGSDCRFAVALFPPLTTAIGKCIDQHVKTRIREGDSNNFEMTALHLLLLGTNSCVMEPGEIINHDEFEARRNGRGTGKMTEGQVVRRLRDLRNRDYANATETGLIDK